VAEESTRHRQDELSKLLFARKAIEASYGNAFPQNRRMNSQRSPTVSKSAARPKLSKRVA